MRRTKMAVITITGILVLLLCEAAAIRDGLLPNGNFEAGPKPSKMQGTRVTGHRAIPKWVISGFVEYIKAGQQQNDMLIPVPEGSCGVRLGNEASIKQHLKLVKDTYYSITLSTAHTCAQQEYLNVSVTPEFSILPVQTTYSATGWDSYAWAFKALHNEVDLIIHNPGMEDDPACGPVIDSIAIKTLYPPNHTGKNLIKNPSFEEGPYVFQNTTGGVIIPPGIEDRHSPLPGWNLLSIKGVKYIDAPNFFIPNIKRAVELVGGKESVLAQDVELVVGVEYKLSFLIGDAGNGCKGSMEVEAYVARGVTKFSYESIGNGGYKHATLKFVATSTSSRIVLASGKYHRKNDGTLCGPVIDDVTLMSTTKPFHF